MRQWHEIAQRPSVRRLLERARADQLVTRLWQRDASLWTGTDEASWLGWLDLPWEREALERSVGEARRSSVEAEIRHLYLLGMGGSSLGAEALRRRFGTVAGYPELRVLDTTDPRVVAEVTAAIDLDPERSLFVVASKSGSTLETDRLCREMLARFAGRSRFWAITDPGSALEAFAREREFERVLLGRRDVGGRFSVLSVFGLVPAAVAGYDVEALLGGALRAAESCRLGQDNPGLLLGAVLVALAGEGRDKLTLFATPALEGLGLWLEQLIAESLGKKGQGVVPIDREPIDRPGVYANDRWFYAWDAGRGCPSSWNLLAEAGHPMIVSSADSAAEIGAELFIWQFATAVAGALMGLHPFDQPDVEAAKLATRRLLEDQRADPGSSLSAADGRQEHFRVAAHHSGPHPTGPHQTEQDERAATPQTLLRQLLAVDSSGLYFAILAYLPETESTLVALQRLRRLVRQRRGWATTLGFGPRYLHSTGQLHKGGANRGRFLVITAEPPVDSLEGADGGVGLGRLQLAQGLGDVLVLAERGRHVVHVHLRCAQTPDLESSLKELVELIGSTLDGTRAA